MSPGPVEIRQLGPGDLDLMLGLLTCFAEAFEDPETYGAARPTPDYWRSLLARDSFIALVALAEGEVVGGLAAYVLPKLEQERSEVYIYDLAVAQTHRRQGIATAMIEALKPIARQRGAWVIYVQADQGDDPPIALYSKLGKREDVLHFDIDVTPRCEAEG
jgi:aminoglycoside 3-N-acetyltransferase I